jgi:hypothetical protein
MPEKLGPKVPADPARAARNRETVRRLVLKRDQVLVLAAGPVIGEANRAAGRARRGSGTRSRS